jgi:hypothetical protein
MNQEICNEINAFHLINSEIAELPLNDKEKLKLDTLIEQDKGFSSFDFVDGISIWEKGKEEICNSDNGPQSYVRFKFREEKIPEQYGGTSFFHKIGGKDWHIRIHKGE